MIRARLPLRPARFHRDIDKKKSARMQPLFTVRPLSVVLIFAASVVTFGKLEPWKPPLAGRKRRQWAERVFIDSHRELLYREITWRFIFEVPYQFPFNRDRSRRDIDIEGQFERRWI